MNGEGRWNLVINEDITDTFKLSFLSFWVWSMFSWLITAQSPYWPDLFTLFHGSVSFRSSEEVGEKPRLGQYKPPKSLLGSSYNTLGFQMVVRGIFFWLDSTNAHWKLILAKNHFSEARSCSTPSVVCRLTQRRWLADETLHTCALRPCITEHLLPNQGPMSTYWNPIHLKNLSQEAAHCLSM